ncbi:MAG TPA: hypothetical protein VLB68_19495, partial [Pyrinomonadaceae bacterium]|nr:hypothetical protein [Pyrinomonadaceae bacterium]
FRFGQLTAGGYGLNSMVCRCMGELCSIVLPKGEKMKTLYPDLKGNRTGNLLMLLPVVIVTILCSLTSANGQCIDCPRPQILRWLRATHDLLVATPPRWWSIPAMQILIMLSGMTPLWGELVVDTFIISARKSLDPGSTC